jgi:hypothetical protein
MEGMKSVGWHYGCLRRSRCFARSLTPLGGRRPRSRSAPYREHPRSGEQSGSPVRPYDNAGRRSVPLDAQLVAAMRGHRKRQFEERLKAGEAWEDTGYVLTDELGSPIRPRYLSRHFNTLTIKAGVRRVRLRDSRHSAANDAPRRRHAGSHRRCSDTQALQSRWTSMPMRSSRAVKRQANA